MNITLLIGIETLKKLGGLGKNMNAEVLRTSIKKMQEIKIQQVIGTLLFEKLKAEIEANNVSVDDVKLLNEYIFPALTYHVLADLVYTSNYTLSNTGVAERTSENSAKLSADELKALHDKYANDALYYSSRITDFLCANTDKYAEYGTKQTSDDLRGKREQYDTGLYLG